MWVALGQCYEAEPLGQLAAAVRCYRRAAACGDKEGLALHKLVRLRLVLFARACCVCALQCSFACYCEQGLGRRWRVASPHTRTHTQ